ncbi:Aste57867_23021 [Aphanomyces stellatus]|uniref:Aste57867_23021 protein n=1 Tax=Aphanomyces stellatus TaxID=120398 RepID=A0A485LLL7_9STRA|nr:hypothetical protein As57867_022950 [Aphanomyces stellatus]VFT99669.1 Aste57867_23021 [Aphanomyces stellatus]
MDMDLASVKRHVEESFAAVDALADEMTVLRKLIYKNTSQHRRAQYFQYLLEVKRMHRALKKDDAKSMLHGAIKLLDLLTVTDSKHHVSWKVLGSNDTKATLDAVLRQLQAYALGSVSAMDAASKAYRALGAQYAMTFFMPFCVVTTSLLGRLFTLQQTLLVRCVEAHHALTLAYLAQTTLSNPFYANTVAVQLQSYQLDPNVVLPRLELRSLPQLVATTASMSS